MPAVLATRCHLKPSTLSRGVPAPWIRSQASRFCAIGLFVGSIASGSAAPAIANLIYLPMSFLSGLWMPLAVLPAFIAKIAPTWPAWHLGRLALAAVGQAPGEPLLPHALALGAVAVVFTWLARRRLARG